MNIDPITLAEEAVAQAMALWDDFDFVLIGSRDYSCHREILCRRSPLLAKYLNPDIIEIDVSEFDDGTVWSVIQFLYIGYYVLGGAGHYPASSNDSSSSSSSILSGSSHTFDFLLESASSSTDSDIARRPATRAEAVLRHIEVNALAEKLGLTDLSLESTARLRRCLVAWTNVRYPEQPGLERAGFEESLSASSVTD
jgi:hypothetical protein